MPKTHKRKDQNHNSHEDINNESLKKLSDPRSFGPGGWLVIHILAYNATSEKHKKSFERDMKNICGGLKCNTCKGHCVKYLEDNPITDYWNIKDKEGNDIGMFQWSWAFHNAVNARLGKPIMDFDTAYHLFSDHPDTVCSKDCEEDVSSSPAPPPPKKNYTYRTRIRNNGLVKFVPTSSQRSSYKRRY